MHKQQTKHWIEDKTPPSCMLNKETRNRAQSSHTPTKFQCYRHNSKVQKLVEPTKSENVSLIPTREAGTNLLNH